MRLAPFTAVLLLAPGLLDAGERTALRLERALAREAADMVEERREAGVANQELAALLAELQERDVVRRKAFAAAANRHLPAGAVERLRRAREAYDAGHGRLLRLLLAITHDGSGPGRAGVQAARISEAREILGAISEASRQEPLSSAEPRLRAPSLVAPLPSRTGSLVAVRTEGGPPTTEVATAIPAAVKNAAETLAGPIEIYEWVRNSIQPELYYGALKGAEQTLFEQSGNDADTAALLIDLFRAKEIPARFVRGTVELQAGTLATLAGTTSAEAAVRALERAGIPHETVLGAGGIASVKLARIWAEAYLPYANYRGALLDAQGKTWVALDPGIKRLQAVGGLDVARELGFDPRAALDAYLAAPRTETPLEFVRAQVAELLAQQRPGLSYADVLTHRNLIPESLGVLPGSLPYPVVERTEVSYSLPEALVHTVRILGHTDRAPVLDATFPVSELLGRRFTLSYLPATEEDAEVVRAYGSLQLTPPYLIDVKPVLKSGGVVVAAGSGQVGMAVKYTLRMELAGPGGTQEISNTVIAGNLIAIGLGGRRVTQVESQADQAAQILAARALSYLERWNRSDEELAELFRVVPVRPTASACLVMSDIAVEYAGGDPLYPLSFDWTGIAIDADLRASAPAGVEGREAERAFLLFSGLQGSVLEHRVFEDDLDIPSVSTAKALQLATAQGIQIHDLTTANLEAVLPGLPLDAGVKQEVRDAVARGLMARLPASEVSDLSWIGLGYLLLDEATGEAAYQLQGGRSGGVTAPAASQIPDAIRYVLEGQNETPATEGSAVAWVAKFAARDWQEGTVGQRVAEPLRVRVSDVEGAPVPHAPVTFTVIGGDGELMDPATAVSASREVTVLSNDRGEAETLLTLGKRTDLIPRFTREDWEENATQVGLNLVTARSGAASLAEPFTAVGFPDLRFDGANRYVDLQWRVREQWDFFMPNLGIGGLLTVGVSDQHGNPVSNVPIRFSYRPDPEQQAPPPGWYHMHEPTTMPGHLLTVTDYVSCLRTSPYPVWNHCPGEAQSVSVKSSAIGASAYTLLGDSPYSDYNFAADLDGGTFQGAPASLSTHHGTGEYMCPSPHAANCMGDPRRPDPTYVNQGTRPFYVSRSGNLVEAYPPEGQGRIGLWASMIYEEARVETVLVGWKTYYLAIGLNKWTREPLTTSEFALTPETPGTAVDPATATGDGTGNYNAQMILSPTPGLNTVRFEGAHRAPGLRYGGDLVGTWPHVTSPLEPEYVDAATLSLIRRPPETALRMSGTFSLWGVDLALTGLNPTPLLVSPVGTVAQPVKVGHRIEPDAYRQLLDSTQVLFEVKEGDTTVAAANGADGSPFVIPQGLPYPPVPHTAHLRVLGVSAGGVDLAAPMFNVPACTLLDLKTKQVTLRLVKDPLNGTTCGTPDLVVFNLCRPARVTLTAQGQPVTGFTDDQVASGPVSELALGSGEHAVLIPAGSLGEEAGRVPFLLRAVDQVDPSLEQEEAGVLVQETSNRSVLSVGHTFVKGVDLLDGHLVQQATDLKLPGRHLGLEVSRTYSSAGHSDEGAMGAGWTWNYAPRLTASACGQYVVRTADGSSQVFGTTDGGHTLTPQKGYHTRLLENANGTYDFIDKAGTVHRFDHPLDKEHRNKDGRLLYVEEPHGDRLVPTYGDLGRVDRVAEVHPETGEVRALEVTYATFGLHERVTRVSAASLGLQVDYSYDSFGNLVRVTRSGKNNPSTAMPDAADQVTGYEYATTDQRDRHQLAVAVDANGNRTEYRYYAPTDPFPGEDDGLLVQDKQEYVKAVMESPIPASRAVSLATRFSYDYADALSTRQFKVTVRDARGEDTQYVLNGNGSPLEIHEPLGKTTVMEWAAEDILKMRETDALRRVTDYGYDARGNLRSETIRTADFGDVLTTYEYDSRFNKLTLKRDAEGRETRYTIDPATGDLMETRDAVGNLSRYRYDSHGRIEVATDARDHHTTYQQYDSFGNAHSVTDPEGNVTTREHDTRGRLFHQSDTLGRDATTIYDGLDRPTRVTRAAGGTSDDEVTTNDYYPGGQVKSVTNALGAKTTYTLDGLNRVTATLTDLGSDGVLRTATDFDGNGNKTRETDRRNVVRKLTYDALNRLHKVEVLSGPDAAPLGEIASYDYDLVGNKSWETDLARLRTDYVLDGLYRVTKKLLPESGESGRYSEEFAYDKVGNRLSATDANGHPTTFAYDGLNRVTRTTNALGQVTTVTYDDPEGSHVNKSEEHDLTRGLRTSFRYDALNRETERQVQLEGVGSAGEIYITNTAYEDPAHAVTVTDPRNSVTRSVLDGLDRVVERVVDVGRLNLATHTRYDALGDKTAVMDPRGKTTQFAYDRTGRLKVTTDARLKDTSYTYDGEGLKLTERDRRGVVKRLTYDNVARLRTSTIDPALTDVPWRQETVYQDLARKRLEIDARGKQTTLELDGLNRVRTLTDAHGKIARTTWDGVNRREEIDKRGNTTRHEYDVLNRPTLTTDPIPYDTQTYVTAYDDAVNTRTETDRRSVVKVTQTDPLGRVLSVTRGGITLETHSYDGNGNRVSSKDAEGKETRFGYDAMNRLSSRTEGYGTATAATTTYDYDENGNQTLERDQRAADLGQPFSVHKTYDELNRLETVTDGETDVTTYAYDEEGNRTLVREPEGEETEFGYDELGKLIRVTQPPPSVGDLRPVTTYGYDPSRNRLTQTDANGHVVSMAYDDLNRLSSLTQDPGGLNLVTKHDYDENGNEWLLTDAKGQTVTSTYDELNRLKTKAYAFADGDAYRPWRHTTGVVYTYDPNSNLHQVDEQVASGSDPPPATLTTIREHDDLDRLQSETTALPDGGSRIVRYTYYGNGARKTVTDPAGLITRYTYDGQNRLETATTGFDTPQAASTIYTYWPDDLLDTVSYPNKVTATHSYDKADRLTSLVNATGTAVVSSYGYPLYDRNGNRLTQVEHNGGTTETTTYTYDGLNRLATVTYPVGVTYPNGRVVTYGYDAVGNRTRETERTTAGVVLADKQGVFDNANRLKTLADLVTPANSTGFTWDPNGNQETKTAGGVTTRYRYDIRDKLIEVGQGQDIPGRFQYDFEGRRSQKIGVEGVRQYVYDQTSLLAEYDEAGVQVAKYDYGSDRLISLFRTDEGRRYFSFDGLRSAVNLTESDGSVAASYHLDPWGNFRFPQELSHSRNRFAFTGYLWDQETNLYFAKARFYDPTTARFTTQDSFLGNIDSPPSLHRYFYANANPTRYFDPTGHFSLDEVKQKAKDGLTFGLFAVMHFRQEAGAAYDRAIAGAAELLTPGARARARVAAGQDPGVAGGQQLKLLDAARNPDLSIRTRTEAFIEGVQLQPAVIVEESVVRPVQEAPGRARAAGVHVAQAETSTSVVDKAVQYLEAAKAATDAFVGLAVPAAIVSARTSARGATEASAGEAQAGRQVARTGQTTAADVSATTTAPSTGVGRWTPKEVEGRTVYQARDIFDPAKRSSWLDPITGQRRFGDNVQRMADGVAPIGRDGKSVNLHHLLQEEAGPLAEVPSSLHNKLPHKMKGPGESFRNVPVLKQQYEDFRSEYWKQRSLDFQPGQ